MAKWKNPNSFLAETYNQSYDVDGYFGCQCWDYMCYFWKEVTGRWLNTGGTGCVKNSFNSDNAGSEFEMITNKYSLQVGDVVVFGGGEFGHIGMISDINNQGDLVTIQGQNQPSPYVTQCPMTLSDFVGAFRLKEWYPQPVEKSVETVENFKVGDHVVPIELEDYYGTPLVQYDDEYIISEIYKSRVVLSARGSVWAALNINNIKKV